MSLKYIVEFKGLCRLQLLAVAYAFELMSPLIADRR